MKDMHLARTLCLALVALIGTELQARRWNVERINVENPAVQQYLRQSNSTFSEREGRLARAFFDEQHSYRPDQPVGKQLHFACKGTKAHILVAHDERFRQVVLDSTLAVMDGQGEFLLTNLVPGQRYYYRVSAARKNVLQGVVEAEGQLRMIAIDHGFNIRDLGGWTGLDGKRVRYGWLYRGGSLGGTDKGGNESTLPEADQRELHRIGIRAQLDLRAPTNRGKYAGEGSLHSYSLGRTTLLEADFNNTMTDYGAYNQDATVVSDVEWIIDKLQQGKPVYFNCRQGADRTGTIAFVLEGLLGCYDHPTTAGGNQMALDYELTGFSQANLVDNWRVPTSHRSAVEAYTNRGKLFRQILDLKAADGRQLSTVQEKCYYYLTQSKDVRIAPAKLDWFIHFMLEPVQASSADQPLTLSQVPKVRKQVWEQWRAMQESADTSARMIVQPLSNRHTYHWQLPSELEPHAIMNFYAGTKGERPADGYPLFVYLHGSGPRQGEWETGLRLAQAFDDAPSMYVIPQIPNEGQYYRWWQQSKQWAWNHLLRQMLANPDIDPTRIYLFGISEGGYGSQRLASFYADYLAGAAPMAGGEPLRNAPAENLSHTAFSLVTGEQDMMFYRNQLTLRTMERLDSLQKDSPGEYPHRVMLEAGRGHAITYGVATPWLKKYQRDATPMHFRWENYEMDGLKRNCFYNLEVLEESSGEQRTDYEFSISNNTIRLEVREVEYVITKTDPNWGIELDNTRRYTPSQHGKVRIYLDEKMANLGKKVTVYVNGRKQGTYRPQLLRTTMERSCQLFGDPLRLFPASITLQW